MERLRAAQSESVTFEWPAVVFYECLPTSRIRGIFLIAFPDYTAFLMKMLSRDDMEQRRIEAGKELLEGIRPSRVAANFGVSRAAAARWNRAITTGGVESLKKHIAPGRPSRLTLAQKAQIANWVDLGPAAFGQRGHRWTAAQLAQLVEDRLGIRYNSDYIRKLLLRISTRYVEERLSKGAKVTPE